MSARQARYVEALKRALRVIERHSLDGYAVSTSIADAALLRELAAALEKGQEMYQAVGTSRFTSVAPLSIGTQEWRRVLVIPWDKEC